MKRNEEWFNINSWYTSPICRIPPVPFHSIVPKRERPLHLVKRGGGHAALQIPIFQKTDTNSQLIDSFLFFLSFSNLFIYVFLFCIFHCICDAYGIQVAWIHIDRQMILTIHRHVISKIPRYSITYDNANTWQLHVNQAQQEDRG